MFYVIWILIEIRFHCQMRISVNCKLSLFKMVPTARTGPDSKNVYLCNPFIEVLLLS